MATLNETADTYAVGMILYQLYNDGSLPFKDKAPDEALPSPVNADYEIAEIIMKAIDPDPAKRWQEPKELGKALAAYMQRNSINDTPITIYTPIEAKPGGCGAVQPAPAPTEAPAQQEETIAEDTQDETLPEPADAADLLPHQMSEEVSQIMDEADALIAHEVPQTAVTPEPEEDSPTASPSHRTKRTTSRCPTTATNPLPTRRKKSACKGKRRSASAGRKPKRPPPPSSRW